MKVATAQALKDAGYPQKAVHRRGNPRGTWRRSDAGTWGRVDALYIPDVEDLIKELTKNARELKIKNLKDGYFASVKLIECRKEIGYSSFSISECLAWLYILADKIIKEDIKAKQIGGEK